MDKNLLDLKESKLLLEGTPTEQKAWSKKISDYVEDLEPDRSERKQIYSKRRDFFTGNQGDYSNIVGIIRDTKQKRGHTNQVTNYAGKTVVKMAFGLANNPPKLTVTTQDINDTQEGIRSQAVEDYQDTVFDSKENKFWKKTYRRTVFHQGEFGDAAIKTFIENNEIKIVGHDDLTSLLVGWNGNPGEFDFVVAETYVTPQSVYDCYGIKVNEKALGKQTNDPNRLTGSWENNQWAAKSTNRTGETPLPTGKTLLPKVKVQEFDSADVYAIKIEGELVQLVFKDDVNFPKVKFWTIVPNIPNPPSPWSIADIDYLMDVQIELNENDNRSADHLRVGNVQRYVAYNMNDFDPESIKTSSGQVIFVNDPDGKSKFEPLPTNVNNFPDDQYHQRKLQEMYDMGLPKVNYGQTGNSSGRSKAIDYQSSIDLTQFKRDAWELAVQDICEKIQILGNFLHPEVDWFQNANGEFVVRSVEFDWTDILPVSQSDKIVNIANKYNMIGLSLKQAYKELGYRNPDAMIEELKQELKDPDLMILRAKSWQLSGGMLQATSDAQAQQPQQQGQKANVSVSVKADAMTPEGQQILNDVGIDTGGVQSPQPTPSVNQPSPTLTTSQNSESAKPMASKAGTTYSSAMGSIVQARQNANAKGQ